MRQIHYKTLLFTILFASFSIFLNAQKSDPKKEPPKPEGKDSVPRAVVSFDRYVYKIQASKKKKDTTIVLQVFYVKKNVPRAAFDSLAIKCGDKRVVFLPKETTVESNVVDDTTKLTFKLKIKLDSGSVEELLLPITLSSTSKTDSIVNPNAIIQVKREEPEPKVKFSETDSSTLNNFIRWNTYSDVVGLSSSKPNGLIQTELMANFTFFRDDTTRIPVPLANGKDTAYCNRVWNNHFFFLKNLYVGFTFSKLDGKMRDVPMNYFHDTILDSTFRHVNIFDAMEHSNISFTGNMNILTFKWRSGAAPNVKPFSKYAFYLDWIGNFYRTTLVDTASNNDRTADLILFGTGANLKFRMQHYMNSNYKGQHIGFELGFGALWLNTSGNKEEVVPRYGPVYTLDLQKNNLLDENKYPKKGNNIVFLPKATVFYEKSDRQRVYFTASLYNNYGRTNRFFQLQIGYSQTIGMKQLKNLFN